VPHQVGPRRAGDPPVLVASYARAAEVLGWKPTVLAPELARLMVDADYEAALAEVRARV
jgi:UDP-glucose 4-epimerase